MDWNFRDKLLCVRSCVCLSLPRFLDVREAFHSVATSKSLADTKWSVFLIAPIATKLSTFLSIHVSVCMLDAL